MSKRHSFQTTLLVNGQQNQVVLCQKRTKDDISGRYLITHLFFAIRTNSHFRSSRIWNRSAPPMAARKSPRCSLVKVVVVMAEPCGDGGDGR